MKHLSYCAKITSMIVAACAMQQLAAREVIQNILPGEATLKVETIGPRAYRVTVTPDGANIGPNPYYISSTPYEGETVGSCRVAKDGLLEFVNQEGEVVLSEEARTLIPNGEDWSVSTSWLTPGPQQIIGTGQYQDGYLDVRGLTRRLTQVNTQIAIPMVISDKGYGILWNNCGLTDWNPTDMSVEMQPMEAEGDVVVVNVTGTEGNRQERRSSGEFTGTLTIEKDGDYAFLLDCGQQMARKHYLEIDGEVLTRADNIWLPPTTSAIKHLKKGEHKFVVKGDRNDHPQLTYRYVDQTSTMSSPVAQGIDYTVMLGTPDQIIAQMRALTGEVPMMPKWAYGYIHCRERFDTQAELLDNATEFRSRNIPVDVIVQDWQWWGNNGWNAMKFDEKKYPDPKAMTDSLHNMDMRIMLSVWAKVDKNSDLGKEFEESGYYIPNTDWIDFFSDKAAEGYWMAYRDNLLPTGIDAWWQDATEPENDDLHNRMVANGTIAGDKVRNIFPLVVNDRVYRGLCEERPDSRPMIMTRSGAPGIQRYGVMTWSGDVGNDWQTLERQIVGALGQMAAGVPWWTYDAGGFFRPGDQYNNADYQQRMLRWIQNAVFLPFMRVHGYMSQTEPWRYSEDTYDKFVKSINLRYKLVPYIYSEAAKVTTEGSTLMRPMTFDFNDPALPDYKTQYMCGHNLLVCPVTGPENVMYVYLPETQGGWYDLNDGRHYTQYGRTKVSLSDDYIPVYVKAGSIIPWHDSTEGIKSTTDITKAKTLTLKVYPGANGTFKLYDDDGVTNKYKQGEYSEIDLTWNDANKTLIIDAPKGAYHSPIETYRIELPDGTVKTVKNKHKSMKIKL